MKKNIKSTPSFVPGGQSTQLIVGATPESDFKIINLSQNLYDKFALKRVYYSAYVPVVKNDKYLPEISHPPMIREHRLYQADWLLRFYGFKADELLKNKDDNFDLNYDPKTQWALANLNYFPMEINKVPYEMLLRIPGIGVTSAKKILKIRRVHNLNFDDLKKLRVVLKRAKYFLTCNGKYYGDAVFDDVSIKHKIIENNLPKKNYINPNQISFFDYISSQENSYSNNIITSSYKNLDSELILPKNNILSLPEKITSINGEF